MNLGTCCICEKTGDDVRNIMTLEQKSPMPGRGWGCVVCGLAADGASAVLCDDCLERNAAGATELRFACAGYPGEDGRVEIAKLTGVHRHESAMHREDFESTTDFNFCKNCRKICSITDDKRCDNCGEFICVACGCTESAACIPFGVPCGWRRPGVCTACG